MPLTATQMTDLRERLAVHLDAIAAIFKRPRLTLYVRDTELPDGDLLIGDDDMSVAIAGMSRLLAHPDRSELPAEPEEKE